MERKEILHLLYDKYIVPTQKKRESYIGIEIEMPIVNLNKAAVDFNIVHKLTDEFLKHYRFKPTGIDDDGHIYSAENCENQDVFSYDCSYNNLELSFGREKNLNVIYSRFLEYYRFIQLFLKRFNYTLTGMGINPYRKFNQNVPINNGRYKMLYHYLSSFTKYRELPMYFHKYPQFGMFSSASQVQIDVTCEQLPAIIDTFNKLEPIKALLLSNSVLLGENESLLCCRDMLWENSTHGINPHNIGMYDCDILTVEDLLNYIATASIYCVEREKKYLNFTPINLLDYFNCKEMTGEYVEHGKVKKVCFSPSEEDIKYLRTFKFEDLTYRGTVEFRSACCQPINSAMTVAAFHIGLMNKTDSIKELLLNDTSLFNNGYNATELRKQTVQKELPSYIDAAGLYRLTEKILDLCREGLLERHLGEEVFLEPLYLRVYQKTNPAHEMLKRLKNGDSLENVLMDYAKT